MFRIGQLSKATGLSVKAIRFYQEKGLLEPAHVDSGSGYRYFDAASVERARIIVALRRLDFSIEDIGTILADCSDESDVLEHLERQKATLRERMRRDRDIVGTLDTIIRQEREAREAMKQTDTSIGTKEVDTQLIASLRMRGKYSECGRGFSTIARRLGRHLGGKAFCLHWDEEYKEDDADFEACFPLKRRPKNAPDGISVRELPAACCLSLIHRGPYETIGRSYERLMEQVETQGLEVVRPTREIYIKGPGMLFKGNPQRYITEIQMPVVPR